MLSHQNKSAKKETIEPKLEKTGSIWTDAQQMLQAMQAEPKLKTHAAEEHESHGILGHVTHGAGVITKGAHLVKKHLPHALHKIEEVAEVVAEIIHDETSGDVVEDTVCGALTGIAKVGTAVAGMMIVPEVELPIIIESATGSLALELGVGLSAGAVIQEVFDTITKPAGDSVKNVCHGTFALAKEILASNPTEHASNDEKAKTSIEIRFRQEQSTKSLRFPSQKDYLGPKKSFLSPQKTYQRGDEYTKAFNQGEGPWISPEHLSRVEKNLRTYFQHEPMSAKKLFERFLPSFAFETAEEASIGFEQFEKDVAAVFAGLYSPTELAALDQEAFLEHFFSSLLSLKSEELSQNEFVSALNQHIAESPKHENTRVRLQEKLNSQLPTFNALDSSQPLKQTANYAQQTIEYAQAVTLLSHAGLLDKKTGEAANKIMTGASAISYGSTQLAATGFSAGPAGLVLAGGLVCMSVVADLFRDDDEDSSPHPVLAALEAQAKQLFELFQLCASMYKEMKQEFSLLHAKLDEYHLDHVERFLNLMRTSESNHVELKTYLQSHLSVLTEQLQELQSVLPQLREASYQLKQQSIEHHLEILDGLKRLDLAPDRRLVTRVRSRLQEHSTTGKPISAEELERLSEELHISATAEAKEEMVTHAKLPLSFLSPDIAVWSRDMDEMDRHFIRAMQKSRDLEFYEALAANYIGFLTNVSQVLGGSDLRLKDRKLSHPLLILDRARTLIALLDANRKQASPLPLSPEIAFRLQNILHEIEALKLFYNLDLETLSEDLVRRMQQDLETFCKEVSKIQQNFYLTKIEASRHQQQALLNQDLAMMEMNSGLELRFRVPEEWKTFYYRFGLERYRHFWVYHEHPPYGRQYIYTDPERGGSYKSRWEEKVVSMGMAWIPPFTSCFQSALPSFPYTHVVPGAQGTPTLSDEQAETNYSDAWGHIGSAYLTFDEFVEELMLGTSSGLEPSEFKHFTHKLHDFNEKDYQNTCKAIYEMHHARAHSQLAGIRGFDLTQDFSRELDKPLPLRVAKARPSSKGRVAQGLLIDLEKLDLHPSLRHLENMGLGFVAVEYDLQMKPIEDSLQNRLCFSIYFSFKYHSPTKDAIPLFDRSLTKIVLNTYSPDEILFLMWNIGEYATGARRDFSSTLISNWRPVPEFPTKHPLLLNELNVRLNRDLSAEVLALQAQWDQELSLELSVKLGQVKEPLRQYFKRMECHLTCLKAFLSLAQHQVVEVKALVEEPALAYFEETSGLALAMKPGDILSFYQSLFKEKIKDKILAIKWPEKIYSPSIDELHHACLYYQGRAKSDQFLQKIEAVRREDRIAYEAMLAELKEKELLARISLEKVKARLSEEQKAYNHILQDSEILVKTGILPPELMTDLGFRPSIPKTSSDEKMVLIEFDVSVRPDGILSILQKYWSEGLAENEIYAQVLGLLKSKAKISKALVNEIEISSGKTPLHLACAQGNLDLVKLLLAEEADTTILDLKGRLAWEYASESFKLSMKALIETRGHWQEKAKDLGFSFNRALWLIEQAMTYFKELGEIEKPGLLFLGPTRAGKSTLMNACLGTAYERAGHRVQAISGEVEYAKVGHRSNSETMHPNVVVGSEYALVDCPGFDETRGLAQTISHGLSFHVLAEELPAVQGMVLVCSELELQYPFVHLRRYLEQIGRMTMGLSLEELQKNLCLMVTKSSVELNHIDELKAWLEDDFSEIDADSDENEWAVKRLLLALTQSKDGILIADVTSKESIEKVKVKFSSLNPLEMHHYHFSRPQHELQVFRNFLKQMSREYQALIESIEGLQYGLIRQLYDELNADIYSFPVELSVLKEELRNFAPDELVDDLEATEALSQCLDLNRHHLLKQFHSLLQGAKTLSSESKPKLQERLEMMHTEFEVNRIFFEQIERISAMFKTTPSFGLFKPRMLNKTSKIDRGMKL